MPDSNNAPELIAYFNAGDDVPSWVANCNCRVTFRQQVKAEKYANGLVRIIALTNDEPEGTILLVHNGGMDIGEAVLIGKPTVVIPLKPYPEIKLFETGEDA